MGAKVSWTFAGCLIQRVRGRLSQPRATTRKADLSGSGCRSDFHEETPFRCRMRPLAQAWKRLAQQPDRRRLVAARTRQVAIAGSTRKADCMEAAHGSRQSVRAREPLLLCSPNAHSPHDKPNPGGSVAEPIGSAVH